MQEFMTSAAQQFDDQEKLPEFEDEDIDIAFNQATSPEEQYSQIERKYGIPRDVMERLETKYSDIKLEALVPSKKPGPYQKALHELLDIVEETLIMNKKTMPYEHPNYHQKCRSISHN